MKNDIPLPQPKNRWACRYQLAQIKLHCISFPFICLTAVKLNLLFFGIISNFRTQTNWFQTGYYGKGDCRIHKPLAKRFRSLPLLVSKYNKSNKCCSIVIFLLSHGALLKLTFLFLSICPSFCFFQHVACCG